MRQSEAAKTLSGTKTESRGRPRSTSTKEDDEYTLCLPVPDNAPEAYKTLKFADGKYRTPSMIHTYTDANGAVLRFIYRFESGDGLAKKEFKPLTCWRDKTGKLSWRFKDIPNNRPLYGLEALVKSVNYPVLVVSGEKCVDAIKNILQGYVVVTWSGGDNGADKTDFTPLTGRQITWWPDNDISCKNTMRRLADKFSGRIMGIDADKYPKGWDCADAVADGIDVEQFINAAIMINHTPTLSEQAPINIFEHTTDKGKILGTLENLQALMDYYKLKIWYNEISKIQECSICGVIDKSNDINSFYTKVLSVCNVNRMPRYDIMAYLDYEAKRNKKNPVLDWINSHQWDKITRVKAICESVQCDDNITIELTEALIMKWLLSAYAAASRNDGDDFRTRGVLVLQGKQGIGKTTFLRKLCGQDWGGDIRWFGEGLTLDPENKDSIMNAQRFWITELAELENTTKRSMPALKALLTNSSNTMRLPYAKAATTIWSRTVYAGTVNQKDVLMDLTGNSRFWCLSVLHFGDISNIDMQQLWAEVKYFKESEGTIWWLTPEEEAQLEENNQEYMVATTAEELLESRLDWNTNIVREMWTHKTCTAILKDCGMSNPTQGDSMRAAHYMRVKLNIDKAPRRSKGGARFYPCPPLI
jgi:hypothetical protein